MLAAVALVAVAIALRVPALFQDAWIDEVWSWRIARSSTGFLAAVANPSSNNHPLVTAWMRLVGPDAPMWVDRAPSLLAGIATVVLAGSIARRAGRAAWLATLALVATSFLPIVYSTEARGYAIETASALAAFVAVREWNDTRRRAALVGAWLALAVGSLAQFLVAIVWIALLAWSVVRVARRASSVPREIVLHAPLAAWFVALWIVLVRHLQPGGAAPWSGLAVAEQTLTWTIGLPVAAWALVLGLALVVAVLWIDARRLARAGDDSWAFQIVIVAVAPLALALVLRNEYLAPRYFLVPIAFWLVSLGRVIGAAWELRGRRALGALIAIAACAAGLVHVLPFLRVGRGDYSGIVREMAASSSSNPLRVAGNFDFNVSALLEYHARALPPGRTMRYSSGHAIPSDGVDFVIVDEPFLAAAPPAEQRIGAFTFDLVRVARRSGPCGSEWALYRRH